MCTKLSKGSKFMNKRIIGVITAAVALSAAAALQAPAAQAQRATQTKELTKLQLQTQGKVTGSPTKKPNGSTPASPKKITFGKPQIKPPPAP
jgi:hypothetical protein